jgi:hypothetical protein
VFDYDGYRLGLYPVDPERLVGIEYTVDDADAATLVAFADTTFPPPDGAEGPILEFETATFDTATISFTATDPLLASRTRPTDDPDAPYSTRSAVGGLVFDLDPETFERNLLGFTTRIDASGQTDTIHVAWRNAVESTLRTVVRMGSSDLRVGVVAVQDVGPDAIGPLDAPDPPGFANILPDVPVVPGPDDDITIRRPDWSAGDFFVVLSPEDGGEPLFGSNTSYWTVVIPEGNDSFHLPHPPGGRAHEDVLGGGDLMLVASVTNDVQPADGLRWIAFDARYTAHAP